MKKQNKEREFCPMKYALKNLDAYYCDGEDCAWFYSTWEKCAVIVLAKSIDYLQTELSIIFDKSI